MPQHIAAVLGTGFLCIIESTRNLEGEWMDVLHIIIGPNLETVRRPFVYTYHSCRVVDLN